MAVEYLKHTASTLIPSVIDSCVNYYNPITCIHCTCIILVLYVYLYSIFLGSGINDSLPDYDVIDETDPYYCSINECDMLSNFTRDIADQAAIADTMPSSVNGCSPPSPVLRSQRSLDINKVDFQRPHEDTELECDSIGKKSDVKPVYRKTPVPNRKLTIISENVTVSPSRPKTQQTGSEVPCESKLSSYESQLKTHQGDGQTIDPHNTTEASLVQAVEDESTIPTSLDKQTDNSSQQPEYCNIDMLDALSVCEVYTI